MLLAIDAGNTQVVLGCFQKEVLLKQWRLSTHLLGTPDELLLKITLLFHEAHLDLKNVHDVIVSSVVPTFTWSIQKAFIDKKLIMINERSPFSFKINLKEPENIGADRLVNAEAVFHKYQKSAIIVDSGTATTLCALSEKYGYLGGAIIPGLEISFEALTKRAAKLSVVEMKAPERAIGRNTKEALQSGVLLGYASLIDGMIERFRKELEPQEESDLLVIATGGVSLLLQGLTENIDEFDPDLTLTGLKILYEKYVD